MFLEDNYIKNWSVLAVVHLMEIQSAHGIKGRSHLLLTVDTVSNNASSTHAWTFLSLKTCLLSFMGFEIASSSSDVIWLARLLEICCKYCLWIVSGLPTCHQSVYMCDGICFISCCSTLVHKAGSLWLYPQPHPWPFSPLILRQIPQVGWSPLTALKSTSATSSLTICILASVLTT